MGKTDPLLWKRSLRRCLFNCLFQWTWPPPVSGLWIPSRSYTSRLPLWWQLCLASFEWRIYILLACPRAIEPPRQGCQVRFSQTWGTGLALWLFFRNSNLSTTQETSVQRLFTLLKVGDQNRKWSRIWVTWLQNQTGEILRRWAEYHEELYTKPQPEDHSWEPTGEQSTEPETTRHEVEIVLTHIRNNKSPGIHGIAIEMWKAAGEEGVTLIWKLCVQIWKSKEWSRDWCRGVLSHSQRKET